MRSSFSLFLVAAITSLAPPSSAQDAPARQPTEVVRYQNPVDGMPLSGRLTLPPGQGPFPGIGLLSVADASGLVDRLVALGYAVLLTERRGMTATDRMLRATYQDLANDGLAAIEYLRARPEVDRGAVGLLGQGDDSPPAVIAGAAQNVAESAGPRPPSFVVLVSTAGLPGVETFRLEQRALAQERRYGPEALSDLDRYVGELTDIVLSDASPTLRAARLTRFMEDSDTGLPRNANFPLTTEGQVLFFTSALWRDRLAFQPDEALSRIGSSALVLMGTEDQFTPADLHLPAVQNSLESARTDDVTVCLLSGRTRHSFSADAIGVIAEWLVERIAGPKGAGVGALAGAREACVEP